MAKFYNTTYSVGDGGLTENDFTDALKTKLDGIAAVRTITHYLTQQLPHLEELKWGQI